MIDNSTKTKIVQKIINSPPFAKNDTLKNLLLYLVKCANKRIKPNEIDIATKVFNRDKSFNPSEDTFVRVYIYKLRKKIDEYYQGPGKQDRIKLVIPKGHYNVEFIETSKRKTAILQKLISLKIPIFIFLVLLFITNFLQWLYVNQWKGGPPIVNELKDSLIWTNFFSNGMDTDFVIGDFFLFQEYDQELKRNRSIIDYLISNDEEFDNYRQLFPSRSNVKAKVGDVPHNSIYNLKDIMNVFHNFQKDCRIKMSSNYSDNDLFNHNIICIGAFKNLRKLEKLLFNIPIEYRYTFPWTWDGELFLKPENSDSTFHWTTSQTDGKDYKINLEVVAKLPGPNGENYLIISGFGYASHVEVVRILSYPTPLLEFENELIERNGSFPKYFFVVFKVTSFQRHPFKTEIIYLKEISANYFQNF